MLLCGEPPIELAAGDLVVLPPMRYLSDVRLQHAAGGLAAGWPTLRHVANRAG